MNKLNFQWKRKTGQYQQGENLYLNRIRLGGYDWNAARPRDGGDSIKWQGQLELPSLKTKEIYSSKPEDVKVELERIATSWFKEALKEIT